MRQHQEVLLAIIVVVSVINCQELEGGDINMPMIGLEDNNETELFKAVANTTDDNRINGGQQVKKIVPYQISMQAFRGNRWRHFCGGSIISPHHVLTAAHCVDNLKVEQFSIVTDTLAWSKGGDRHHVVSKRVHPQFSMTPKIINDIAILKVTPPFNLHKSSISTISLGGSGRVGDRVNVRLTGWGSTTPTVVAGLPDNLQELYYKTITNDECTRKGFRVTPSEICALAMAGKGACVVSKLI